jgi:hypothetical protein
MESPNTDMLAAAWQGLGVSHRGLVDAFRSFNAYAEPFRITSDRHEALAVAAGE